MNAIRKFFGVVWILLGPAAVFFMIYNAINVLGKADKAIAAATSDAAKTAAEAAKTNTILQWGIIIIIFIPVAFGLMVFGKFALQGEYDR